MVKNILNCLRSCIILPMSEMTQCIYLYVNGSLL